MTSKEAIVLLECCATEAVGVLAATTEKFAAKQLRRYIDAYDMAIAALRERDETDTNVGGKTNADRIRAMSDEELAKWVTEFVELVLEQNGLDDKYELSPNFKTDMLVNFKKPYKEGNNAH